MLSRLNTVISNNESTRIKTGHVIYNPAYTYKFQLKTTLALILIGIFVPESPLWLVDKGFMDLSDNVIHFLGRNEEEFASEVEEQLRLKVRSPQKYTENASSTTTQSFLNRITSKEVIQPTGTDFFYSRKTKSHVKCQFFIFS